MTDLLYVRTRLQALIAGELLKRGEIARPYHLIKIHQYAVGENEPSVYRQYVQLDAGAARSRDEVTAAGFMWSFGTALKACLIVKLTKGCVFSANLNNAALALALKLTRARLCTFDDGFANIVPEKSRYFDEIPLVGSGLKRRLIRVLLPRGAADFARRRTQAHFSIFPGRTNVVEPARLRFVKIDWGNLLSREDREKLQRPSGSVLIGTRYSEWPPQLNLEALITNFGTAIDLYFPHPRESLSLHPTKSVRLDAPAEAALVYLAKNGPVRVYHLDSTVAETLAGHPNLIFVNVVPDWSLDDVPDIV